MVVGEAALAVSLADSLFLSIDPGAARSKVILFLAISLAPFAVLAPIIGPYIDRLPGGRRITVCLVGLMRAMVCGPSRQPHSAAPGTCDKRRCLR